MVVENETSFEDETTPVEEASGLDPKVLGLGGVALAAAGTMAWRKRAKIKAWIDAKREDRLEKRVKKLGDKLLRIRKNAPNEEAKTEE